MQSSRPLAILGTVLALAACAQRPPPAAAEPPLATKPTVGQEIGAVAQNKLEITFAPGSTTLNAQADSQLDVAARLFRDVNPVAMFSIGYTDPTGDEFENIILSARRAQAVKRGLVARGIPPDRLRLQALGSSDPANTSNATAPENRRVVVQWRIL
jgi:outer membrane protein OmpA-like peptidoglycan-associated protein